MSQADFRISLPFPPSVNNYWRRVGNRILISKAGREFTKNVSFAVFAQDPSLKPLTGPLAIDLTLNAPDRVRRDLDNTLKALLDSMAKAGVYNDDSQIKEIHMRWGQSGKPGSVFVCITRFE